MAQDLLHASAPNRDYSDESMRNAIDLYRHRLRDTLEAEAMNQYVRLDAKTGDYAVSPTRGDARKSFRDKYGERVAWTLHIGTA